MGILILLISGISNSGPDTHFLLSYYSINISVFFFKQARYFIFHVCAFQQREEGEKKALGQQ